MIGLSLRRALFGVGPVAACRAVLRRVRQRGPTRAPGPSPAPDAFDLAHGVDTAGFRGWRELRGGRESDPYNSGYLAADAALGRTLLGSVAAPERSTFVDLGCGKGRVLVLATEFGFRRVVGVEIDPALAQTARRNAAVVRARFPGRVPIEIVQDDAAAVRFPPEPLVVFLNHPFWAPVLRQVVGNLAASLAEAPREVLVLYLNPVLSKVLDEAPWLERVATALPGADQSMHSHAGGSDAQPTDSAVSGAQGGPTGLLRSDIPAWGMWHHRPPSPRPRAQGATRDPGSASCAVEAGAASARASAARRPGRNRVGHRRRD